MEINPNRIEINMKIFRGIYLLFFGAFIGVIIGEPIWLNTLVKFGICSLNDANCADLFFWYLVIISIVVVSIVETINWVISSHRKNNMLLLKKYKHDQMVASIEVFNNTNELVEGCFARINKVFLVIDDSCQRIIDENINDKRICWDDGSVEVKIYKKSSDVLDIMRAYSENLELLLLDAPNLSMPVYRDMKHGKDARRVNYQLEIEICGIVVKDGNNNPIPPKISYWEIYYQSDGKGSIPKIQIQQISVMAEPTKNDTTRSQMPNTHYFTIILPTSKGK